MTKFNKRHYEAIALVFQDWQQDWNGTADAADLIERFADIFARDNGMFKRERFIAACEPGANVKLRARYKVVA